jgi:uncharacterized alkaline shock family protein YloU
MGAVVTGHVAAVGVSPADASQAGGRGCTRIRDAVVAKIAEQAATEVTAVAGGRRRLAGLAPGRRDRPQVRVTVLESLVTAHIAAALTYPTSLRDSTSQIRRHVTDRVQELTGMRVGAMDVTVTALVPTYSTAPGETADPADPTDPTGRD